MEKVHWKIPGKTIVSTSKSRSSAALQLEPRLAGLLARLLPRPGAAARGAAVGASEGSGAVETPSQVAIEVTI